MLQENVSVSVKLFMDGQELVHSTSITFKGDTPYKEIRELAIQQMISEEDHTEYMETYKTETPSVEQVAEKWEEDNWTLFIEL